MTTLARLLVLALTVACCSGAGAAPALDGREFLSTSIVDNGAQRSLVPGTRVRVHFADGRISLSAGCNIMGGTYRIDGGQLVTDALAMTEMGCDQARHAQDDWLGTFIGSRPTLRSDGNQLILERGGLVLTMLGREVAEPDLPLVGRRWTVTSIVAGDAVSSVPAGAVASLLITADGSVQVETGCNQGGGRVTVTQQTLHFTDIATTLRACDGPGGQLESAVLAVLGAEVVTYRIDAGTLTLTAGQRGLQLQGE